MGSTEPKVPADAPEAINPTDTENFYVLDEEGNPYLRPPDVRPPSRTRGDPKVAAKYQWRASSVFSDRGGESSSSESDDDFEEEFSRILSSAKLSAIPEDEEAETLSQQNRPKLKEYKKLDKDYYDVPDLSNLTITCLDSLKMDLFGTVIQHYDALAMIQPKPGMYYLDVDTMLFDENRKPVGRIYELMGLIESPIYNILCSSEKEAKTTLPLGMQVYYAPEAPEEFTKVLIINQLEAKARRLRNSQSTHESDTEEEDEDPEEIAYYEKLKRELAEYEQRKRQKRGRSDSVTSNRSVQSNAPSQKKQPRHQFQGQFPFSPGQQPYFPTQLPYPPYAAPGMLNTAFGRQPPRNPFALPPGGYPIPTPTWYPPPPPPS